MSPEKSQELIAIYPELFCEVPGMKAFAMFGFECDDGWFDLLKDLIVELKYLCEKDNLRQFYPLCDEPVRLKVSQVKEKYGTLRFYTNWENDDIERAVAEAEERSASVCENCGAAGIMRKHGTWLYVSCEKCVR